MKVYFNMFYPLGCTKEGRIAAFLFSLPLYIDGSYRREPDFEHSRPCITGSLKPGLTRKLEKGDLIVYATKSIEKADSRVVAVLKVIEMMPDHRTAANRYIKKGLKIPSNLIVSKTNPVSYEETHGLRNHFGCDRRNPLLLEKNYAQRSLKFPLVAICRVWKKQVNLFDPPVLTKSDAKRIFGNKIIKDGSKLNDEDWANLGSFLTKRNSQRGRKISKTDKRIAFVLPDNTLSF